MRQYSEGTHEPANYKNTFEDPSDHIVCSRPARTGRAHSNRELEKMTVVLWRIVVILCFVFVVGLYWPVSRSVESTGTQLEIRSKAQEIPDGWITFSGIDGQDDWHYAPWHPIARLAISTIRLQYKVHVLEQTIAQRPLPEIEPIQEEARSLPDKAKEQ